ncbi:MAG: chlorite dismutase family protein [Gemmatimonadota bacterium]
MTILTFQPQNLAHLVAPPRSIHGGTGRRYAGKGSNTIMGSIGLGDWEWAVTLFTDEPTG